MGYYTGTSGNDTIIGSGGADAIYALAGNDFIDSGPGNDRIYAGDGADTIFPGGGNDLIYAQGGDDLIYLSGGDTIFGGDGVDTLNATYGNYAENFVWTSGTTATGSAQIKDVEIFLSGGGDDYYDATLATDDLTISTGAGNDTLLAGLGNDTLTGGSGNDVFGFDGSSDDVITDFGFGNTGPLNDGNSTNNDFIDLTAYYSSLSEAHLDLQDDGILNHSVTTSDYSDNIAITGSLTLVGVTAADITEDSTGLTVCFTRGTLIDTIRGRVPIEQLEAGDLVRTLDRGFKPIVWISSRKLSREDLDAHPNMLPIRIEQGSMGEGLPKETLLVSPQHRMLVKSKVVSRMFEVGEVFVPAKHLEAVPGIYADTDACEVEYFHILLETHAVVFANGLPSETLYLGSQAHKALSDNHRKEIDFLFGKRLPKPRNNGMELARPVVKGAKRRKLIERHAKNNHSLVQDFESFSTEVQLKFG